MPTDFFEIIIHCKEIPGSIAARIQCLFPGIQMAQLSTRKENLFAGRDRNPIFRKAVLINVSVFFSDQFRNCIQESSMQQAKGRTVSLPDSAGYFCMHFPGFRIFKKLYRKQVTARFCAVTAAKQPNFLFHGSSHFRARFLRMPSLCHVCADTNLTIENFIHDNRMLAERAFYCFTIFLRQVRSRSVSSHQRRTSWIFASQYFH